MADRILIIVQNLPVPFDRRVWQEATSLKRAGFEVCVICPKKGMYTKAHEHLDGVEIYRYPLLFEADNGVVGYLVEFAYCWFATLILAIIASLKGRFRAIHACNPPDTYFALAALFRPFGTKFVFDHHDLSPEMFVAKGHPPRGPIYSALLWLERLTIRSAHMVIAVNQSHRSIAIERGGAQDCAVVVVRSGPSRRWADIRTEKPELKRGHRYLVVYLGEMCRQDGVDCLLRMIKHYLGDGRDDTAFALVGGGPDQARMRQLSEELGIDGNTHFTGRIPDSELWEYLSTADVCADPDPKTAWSDLSTMNKMIEYLAFGRPVIAFDLKEHRNTAGNAAVYIPDNNELQMAAALRQLLDDEGRRRVMEAAARQRFVQLLAWENSERDLVNAYQTLLHGHLPPVLLAHDEQTAEAKPRG